MAVERLSSATGMKQTNVITTNSILNIEAIDLLTMLIQDNIFIVILREVLDNIKSFETKQ